MRRLRWLLAMLVLLAWPAGSAWPAADVLPIEVLKGYPSKMGLRMSPDGHWISYIAEHQGRLNLWMRAAGQRDDRPVTDLDHDYLYLDPHWTADSSRLLVIAHGGRVVDSRLLSITAATGTLVEVELPIAPEWPLEVELVAMSAAQPHLALLALNAGDQWDTEAWLVNLDAGRAELYRAAPEEGWTWRWFSSGDLDAVGCHVLAEDGSMGVFVAQGDDDWREVWRWSKEDYRPELRAVGLSSGGADLYLIDDGGLNAAALVRVELDGGSRCLLAVDQSADVADLLWDAMTREPVAVQFEHEYRRWRALDPRLSADFMHLAGRESGVFTVLSRRADDAVWLVFYYDDDGPGQYMLYSRSDGELTLVDYSRDDLVGVPLAPMRPVEYRARDGLLIHGYLTLPLRWEVPGPLVLHVHGGPVARFSWGYDLQAQWLASRGYAVLQVNYRGSTGYGRQFSLARYGEWGGKMQDDLTDAVRWAIDGGVADPERVAIYGSSYGGYAVLAGLAFTPELYACGVANAPLSSIETHLIRGITQDWEDREGMFEMFGRWPFYEEGPRAGQPKDEEDWTDQDRADVEDVRRRSPLNAVDRVNAPLLISHGAEDPYIPLSESEQFVEALRARGGVVELVVFEGQGHGLTSEEASFDYSRRVERFLAEHLGGLVGPEPRADDGAGVAVDD